jgi:hypothetical protein
MATVVTAPTEAEARDKFEMLARHVDAEGMLALRSVYRESIFRRT